VENKDHIHIISSGETIHETFPISINELKMDRAIILVEDDVFRDSDNKHHPLIRESITIVEELAGILKKSFEIKRIPGISLENIRNAVLDIFNQYPDAVYYFNITGGTKVLSNGLFMMSIWLEGSAYHVGEDGKFQILAVPKIHVEDLKKNENYISILEILVRSEKNKKPLKELFTEMEKEYKPLREGDRKAKRNLSRGTLSKWIHDLISWGLVTEEFKKDNKKEKNIKITDDGIFTLKFIRVARKRE
jgi:hypothetical protein